MSGPRLGTSREALGRPASVVHPVPVAVLLLLFSLHLHSLWGPKILGHIDIALADVVTVFLGMVWVVRNLLTQRPSTSRCLSIAFCADLAFGLWIGIEGFRSP